MAKLQPQEERSAPPWLPRFMGSFPPYSIRAIGVAVLCFSSALAVQIIFRSAGGLLMFATYYPAVLAAGLLAGLPAGVVVTAAALLTVWWALMPPPFAFSISSSQFLDIAAHSGDRDHPFRTIATTCSD